jgi:hypothetical protein
MKRGNGSSPCLCCSTFAPAIASGLCCESLSASFGVVARVCGAVPREAVFLSSPLRFLGSAAHAEADPLLPAQSLLPGSHPATEMTCEPATAPPPATTATPVP